MPLTRLLSAQAVIQAILRRTNLLMAGKRVAIVGDAPGLATRLRAMGAHPGTPLREADLVIGAVVDTSLLKPGAILALTPPLPPSPPAPLIAPGPASSADSPAVPGVAVPSSPTSLSAVRVREGVGRVVTPAGDEVFVVDLRC